MSTRSTFSPFWHRVRTLRPRLRPHVQVTRQHYRGRRWHVVRDPSSNQFYRLSPVGHEFLGLLDGLRSVEEVWQHTLGRHGDDALTQNEVIQLLSQLYASNLLAGDVPPETEQLLRRGRERLAKRFQQQAIGLMYLRLRLFNPDAILGWMLGLARPLLGRAGLVLWTLWVLAGLTVLIPRVDALAANVGNTLAPANWPAMMAVFVLVKLVHEAGHGLLCKRFGGQVPEFGAMLLVLMPAPFVDASAAWGFASKWQRIAVGAGGMIFELALASGAAFVWAGTPEGSPAHQIAYNVIFTSGVATIVFNGNPLMKFDGYYILSDLLEVPNLMQRSSAMVNFLFQRHVFRVRGASPPTSSPSEAGILLTYGVLGAAYRVVLFASITLYVMGQMFALGLILAVWTCAMWFLLPAGKFLHWLLAGPALSERRGRGVATAMALAGAVLLVVGVIPLPDRRRVTGVVESVARSGVYFDGDGFVVEAHAAPGQRVEAGQPLVTVRADSLAAQYRMVLAQREEARSKQRQATGQDPALAQVAAEYAENLDRQAIVLEQRLARGVVRAPHAGVVVGDPRGLVGAYVRSGEGVCEVIDDAALRVTAVIPQREASWVTRRDYAVEARLAGEVGRVIPLTRERVIEAGTHELPHESLTYAGGGTIEPDAEDRSGRAARTRVFKGYFLAAGDGASGSPGPGPLASGAYPGERVHLRFTLPARPLAGQWWDRLRQTLQGRAKV